MKLSYFDIKFNPSWTLEQMQKACEYKEFYEQILSKVDMGEAENFNEAIERKFSIVGGSARWMFGYNEKSAMEDITQWLERCSDAKIIQGLTGDRSDAAVNHLLCRDKNGTVDIQSRYIALYLSKKYEAHFIAEARKHIMSSTNPSWDGWVFQMDFFYQLRMALNHCRSFILYDKDNTKIEWKVPRQVEYLIPDNLKGAKLKKKGPEQFANRYTIQPDDWLIPTKWNQGCYDAAQLLDNALRIVQVTRAKTHSLKLRFVRHLIAALVSIGFTIEDVEIVVVVPKEQVVNFKISETNLKGNLADWKWKIDDLLVHGLERSS